MGQIGQILGSAGTASRRHSIPLIAAAAALVLSLVGAVLILLFAGDTQESDIPKAASPLRPIGTPSDSTSAPSPAVPAELPSDSAEAGTLADRSVSTPNSGNASGLGNASSLGGGATLPLGGGATLPLGGGATLPLGGGATLPVLQLPTPPQLSPPPPADWPALLQPYLESQANATAANIGGSITGPTVGAASAAVNSAAVLLGDLILYSAYTNNGQALAQLPPPDFTGLNAAFAAAAAAPPVLGLPAPQLPPPPTPEQFAALAALPLALPALPPPPPLGLPVLPPPPPPLPLPSITRLLGLPF